MMESINLCKICEGDELHEFHEFRELEQVTSDCKPWISGGKLFICMKCSAVQKITDSQFIKSIKDIYGAYTMFHQSEGVEQSVLSPNDDSFEKRSVTLCKFLTEKINLPDYGALLDVGCANGGILKAFTEIKNGWDLFGHDLDKRYLDVLRKIPGFVDLFSGDFSNILGKYDILTIIHAVEHFVSPKEALRVLKNHLSDTGSLFIEVPDSEVNPFDLVVADHVVHFSLKTLRLLLEKTGYVIQQISNGVIYKELSVLVSNNSSKITEKISDNLLEEALQQKIKISKEIDWLKSLKRKTTDISTHSNSFGIFGTSISATWLASSLIDKIDFFVDEDPARIGQFHMNKPILSPNEIPLNSDTFIPLIPSIAEKVFNRINSSQYKLHIPQTERYKK